MHGRAYTAAVLGFLLACVFAQAFGSLRRKSLTYDELAYIPAGYSYVTTGDFRLNPEQPPLMKLLAGAALLPLRPRLPLEHESWIAAGAGVANTQWIFGREFLTRANPDGPRLVRWARVPTVLVTMALVTGVFLFARELYGPLGGVLAATLCAFDPNILAHGRLATTDVGLACFVLWAVYALFRLSRRPTGARVVVAGVFLGMALAAKFSGLFLLALMPVFAIALALSPDGIVVPGGRWGRLTGRPLGDRLAWASVAFAAVSAIGLLTVSLTYGAPGRVDLYLRDFFMVNVNVHPAFPTYFHGTFHPGRVPLYFVAAFLLKTPLGTLALLATRVADVIVHRTERAAGMLLTWIPVVAWFVIISWKAYQIGLRYVLPAYPLLFVFAGGLAASPWLRARPLRIAVLGMIAWATGSSLAAYPHYLPYFNEAAGGAERGIDWLDDSNLDWGQDLVLLAELQRATGLDRLMVTPMAEYDPAIYGVRGEILQPAEVLRRLTHPEPPPGVYAVSAHILNRARLFPAPVDPLRDLVPVAVLGHSIYVYDLR